jgi:hypothetical protein
MPRTAERILVYNSAFGRVYEAELQYLGLDLKIRYWWLANGGRCVPMEFITHWMPLPAPPEVKE